MLHYVNLWFQQGVTIKEGFFGENSKWEKIKALGEHRKRVNLWKWDKFEAKIERKFETKRAFCKKIKKSFEKSRKFREKNLKIEQN